MVHALAIFWIVVTVLTTLTITAMANPINTEVFAQGNTTAEMRMYSDNMTSTTNTTSTNDCEENATAIDDCGSGSISRSPMRR